MNVRRRRSVVGLITLLIATVVLLSQQMTAPLTLPVEPVEAGTEQTALSALEELAVKGRAPRTDYSRAQFGDGWQTVDGCDMRNTILARDLVETAIGDDCVVLSGTLPDPYTGSTIEFARGPITSAKVQIDHVVALSDAWQKGAAQWSAQKRVVFANDPLELLAVDGPANQNKSSSDAASWLPPNKSFRCQYVSRQIAVKLVYGLWVTLAEKSAIARVLASCPDQRLPAGLSVSYTGIS